MMTQAPGDAAGRTEGATTVCIAMDVAQAATTAPATLYSKDNCSFCIRAKMLFENYGINFDYVDLTGDMDGQVALAKRTGRMTMPQIFVGDELIGGYEDLVLAMQNPRIREALGIA